MITNSEILYKKSQQVAPCGVHSPVRAFKAVGGNPIFFERGSGPFIYDEDGNKYVDFCMSWGALATGHAHSKVVNSLQEQIKNGTHFGTPTRWDVNLAEKMLAHLRPFEKVRFVNSGTEAVMTALRLARGITNKTKIIKIDGSYHGHVDSMLVSAGSGLMTQGQSSSEGVTNGSVDDTLVVPYDNQAAIEECFLKHQDIAAIIMEPILANCGLFEPRKEYIEFLRNITLKHKALFIFDEVITGFRIHSGGAKKYFDVEPDLATYGKIIGGGLPVGAVAGRSEFMDHLAPMGKVYQAGTLSGNPLCMRAGFETLGILEESNYYEYIEKDLGPYLDNKILMLKDKLKLPLYYKRVAGIFWICPGQSHEPKTPQDIDTQAAEAYKEVYSKLLSKGVYLSPSVYEVGFLSTAHTKENIDALVNALQEL